MENDLVRVMSGFQETKPNGVDRFLNKLGSEIKSRVMVSKDLSALMDMIMPAKFPDIPKDVQTTEQFDKWLETPENREAFDNWAMGIIPEAGGILKKDALRIFGRSAGQMVKIMDDANIERGMRDPTYTQDIRARIKQVLKDIQSTPQSELDPIREIRPSVLTGPQKRVRGYWHPESNDIEINLLQANSETYWHELTHSRQWNPKDEAVEQFLKGNLFKRTKEIRSKASAMGGLLSDEQKMAAYLNEPIERHARAVAESVTAYPQQERGSAYLQSFLQRLEEIANEKVY